MITRATVKSCCGSRALVLTSDKPIKKSQLDLFKQAGYLVPDNMVRAGLFYVQLGTLVVNGSLGATKFSLKCSGTECEKRIAAFETLLEKAINS